jgi:PAS domain S-box-containing protein
MVLCQDVTERILTRKKIEESEQKFQAAVSAVEGIVWTNNAHGEMIGEQLPWSELTGQAFEEYQGYGWAKAVHPEDAQGTIDAWNEAVKHQHAFISQHRLLTKDKGYRTFSIRAIPVKNAEGTIREWVGVHTDITEYLQAQQNIKESEQRFRSLADNAPMIVYMVEPDSEATMSYFNKTWLEYTGQTFDQAIGRAWNGIVHADDLQQVLDIYVPAFENRQAYTLPAVRLRRHDGEYRWFLFKGTPRYLPNQEFIGFVGVAIDIHDQKLSEFALKKSEETLEKLVRERTIELERSNEDLQQFAHVASHDLKEPVRKIKTFAGRIEQEASERLTEKEKIYVEKIQSASNRMSSMIDGVLQYSSINAEEHIVEHVDIQHVIDEIKTDLEVPIKQKEGVINASSLPVIEGAGVLIYQLFYNLINNSLKFSDPARKPVISITCETFFKSGKEHVKIKLQDNGIGFEAGQSKMIFNTFTRLNSKDKFEGTGIGLALCKKIALRHKGSIEAISAPAKGATFIISLPVKQKYSII